MADALLYNQIMESNKTMQQCIEDTNLAGLQAALDNCPFCTEGWVLLPYCGAGKTASNVLDVQHSSCPYRCGADCTWTVPAGTNKAMFQIWGAGANTMPGCCCGGSEYGANGAYAVAIADVCPGATYVLCSACAQCCHPGRGVGACTHCASTVTGMAGTDYEVCMCAFGGCSGVFRHIQVLSGASCCRFQAKTQTASGACICNSGGDYCFASSCATCGEVEYSVDPDRQFYVSLGGTQATSNYGGFGSVYPVTCFDTNHYGYKIRPPGIKHDHTQLTGTCDCCSTFSSGQCCGGINCGAYCNTCQCEHWGQGATYAHHMGGANSNCGGQPHPGHVKVSWWSQ